jgi:hypothetical protein
MASTGEARPADMRAPLKLRPAWRRNDPDLARDAQAFWGGLDLLGAQTSPQERAAELCMTAYRGGTVVAVSTATLRYWPVLRARLAMFRCAVAPDERQGPVVAQLADASRLLLMEWARANPQEKVKGMGAITSTPGLDLMKRTPIWRYKGLRLILVGFTAQGDPFRVAWFPGLRIEPPGQGFGPEK